MNSAKQKKKEDPNHLYNAEKFARNVVQFVGTSEPINMVGTKAEVSLYLLHMQMLLQKIVKEGKLHAFTDMLFKRCSTTKGMEHSYVEFIAMLAATGASGEAQTSISIPDHPGAKGERVLEEFLNCYEFDERTKTLIAKYSFAFIRAYRDYLKRGTICDVFALKTFLSYLYHAILATQFAVEEGFISGLNSELVQSYGIKNEKQAQYIGEFLERATRRAIEEFVDKSVN